MDKIKQVVIPSGNTRERPDPWQFRPYEQVAKWWAEFNKDKHWKKNQALNLALAKFMGKQDKEVEELYNNMRGKDDSDCNIGQ